MKRTTFSILAALLIPLTFWIGGMEFDRRGFVQGYVFFLTLFIGAVTYTYPGWSKK